MDHHLHRTSGTVEILRVSSEASWHVTTACIVRLPRPPSKLTEASSCFHVPFSMKRNPSHLMGLAHPNNA